MDFAEDLNRYCEVLKKEKRLRAYRLTRCKLGFRPEHLREFHVMLEFEDLGQLQNAFDQVSSRTDPMESFHQAVNSKVKDIFFALYRDFPDENRVAGEERF